jgi:hypothetical protein
MKQIGSVEKIRKFNAKFDIFLSDKLQKCWLGRHTFMANSPFVAIGDRVAHPGTRGKKSLGVDGRVILKLISRKNMFRSCGLDSSGSG